MQKQIDVSARRQVQLGKKLAAQKIRCLAEGRTWISYVKEHCNISRERADELIRIGRGAVSVEDTRSAKKMRQRASRVRKSRTSSRDLLLDHATITKELCSKLSERLSIKNTSRRDIKEMKEAIKLTLAAWEALRCELDAAMPSI